MRIGPAIQRFKHNFGLTWGTLRADLGYGTPSPDSDFWYHRPGFRTASGAYVSPETAMRLASVYACVRVISETMGSLPRAIYRRLPNGGKERANDHPLYDVLQKPNIWQTGFEFFEMMQGHLELRGNAFAIIVPGNGRAIDQLIPLHPDRVRVFRLLSGRLRYEVTSYFDGSIKSYMQDEIVHLRALSSDGIMGISTITAGSEVVGTGLAQMEHRARYFSNHAIPGLAIKTGSKLDKEKRENLQDSVREGFSAANAFKVMVLPPGMEIETLGLTNKDSQLIEAGQATRTDIASMFRLPPHKIGDLSRGTFSNIEQQNIEFATDSIRPRAVRLQNRLNADLVDPLGIGDANSEYFVEFDLDPLLRGDIESRYKAYAQALPLWMLINEVRAKEGLNPVPGGDKLLRAVNMTTADQADELAERRTAADAQENNQDSADDPENDPDPGEENARQRRDSQLRAIAISAGSRVVRREVKGLMHLAKGNGERLGVEETTSYYSTLVPLIAENLVISEQAARGYCDRHAMKVAGTQRAFLSVLCSCFEEEGPAELAALALGEKRHALPAPGR